MAALYPKPQSIRLRVTQGKDILHGADKRTRWYRRLQELIDIHVSEMGGGDAVTQAQFVLVKSAATMTVAMEKLEVGFAQEQELDVKKLGEYVTYVNSLRRVFSELGMTGNPHVPLPRSKTSPNSSGDAEPLSMLTEDERIQFTLLARRVEDFGISTLARTDLQPFMHLMVKVGTNGELGYGTSATDPTSKKRPIDEIAPYGNGHYSLNHGEQDDNA